MQWVENTTDALQQMSFSLHCDGIELRMDWSCSFSLTSATFVAEIGRSSQRSTGVPVHFSPKLSEQTTVILCWSSECFLNSINPDFPESSTIPAAFLTPVSPNKSNPEQSWGNPVLVSPTKIFVHTWKWNTFAIVQCNSAPLHKIQK